MQHTHNPISWRELTLYNVDASECSYHDDRSDFLTALAEWRRSGSMAGYYFTEAAASADLDADADAIDVTPSIDWADFEAEVNRPSDEELLVSVHVESQLLPEHSRFARYRLDMWENREATYVRTHTPLLGQLWGIEKDGFARCIFPGLRIGVPGHQSIDGIDAVLAMLSCALMRPGDTDSEWFDDYTPEQLEFAKSSDCESLQCVVSCAEAGSGDLEESRESYLAALFGPEARESLGIEFESEGE
jgi:hypothetical protein